MKKKTKKQIVVVKYKKQWEVTRNKEKQKKRYHLLWVSNVTWENNKKKYFISS